jgi:flagellin
MADFNRIRSNIQALEVLAALRGVNRNLEIAQLRLATGKKINSAGDDPAGLVIASKLQNRTKMLAQIYDNIGEARNLLGVAEGGLSQMNKMLAEIGTLIGRSASDSIGDDERGAITGQIMNIVAAIDDVATETEFNGVNMLETATTFSFQTGERSNMSYTSASYTATSLGMTNLLALTAGDTIDSTNYETYLDEVDAAVAEIVNGLTSVGSLMSTFTFKEDAIQVMRANTEEAYSRIMDADLAEEQLNYTKFQILQQSTIAMLAQANMNGQNILALFR